jgi:hypothetical protein
MYRVDVSADSVRFRQVSAEAVRVDVERNPEISTENFRALASFLLLHFAGSGITSSSTCSFTCRAADLRPDCGADRTCYRCTDGTSRCGTCHTPCSSASGLTCGTTRLLRGR